MTQERTMSPAEKYAAAKNRQRHPLTAQFMTQYEFPLDDFQRLGCQHLEDGKSVLVAAPTGAGKTIVGEFEHSLPNITANVASTQHPSKLSRIRNIKIWFGFLANPKSAYSQEIHR